MWVSLGVFSKIELDRCVEIQLRQILAGERLTDAFGRHLTVKETGKTVDEKMSWEDLENVLRVCERLAIRYK